MPIISSVVVQVMSQSGNFERLRIEHTDHIGKVWTTRVRVPTDVSRDDLMVLHTAETEEHLMDVEEDTIGAELYAGKAPDEITRNYISNARMLKKVLKTFMRPEPAQALKIAKWVRDNITDAQLDAVITPAIRQKIRARITNLMTMETALLADASHIVRID